MLIYGERYLACSHSLRTFSFCSCDVFSLSCFIPCGCRSAAAFWIKVTSLFLLCLCFARFYRLFFFIAAMMFPYPHRVSPVQLPVCDSFLNYGYFSLSFMSLLCSFLPLIFLHRSHDVSLSPSFSSVQLLICDSFLDYGYFSLSFMSLLCPFLPLIFLHRSHDVSLSPSCFSHAAAYLRRLSESRLLLSFFCKRKRTKKIFRGGVPPPQKLPLPRLGQAASRHRLSDASVRHLKWGAAI